MGREKESDNRLDVSGKGEQLIGEVVQGVTCTALKEFGNDKCEGEKLFT